MKRQQKAAPGYVSVSLKLTGEIGDKFLELKDLKHLRHNADLAYVLLAPAIEEELKKHQPQKTVKPRKVA